jgi:hypothetical protein
MGSWINQHGHHGHRGRHALAARPISLVDFEKVPNIRGLFGL